MAALLGAPGERGRYQFVLRIGRADTKKAADHGISTLRHGRVTQPREARRPSLKGRGQPRASRRHEPCAYDLYAAAAPSLRCIAADLRRSRTSF